MSVLTNPARRLHVQEAEDMGDRVSRDERDFLAGFSKAALLTQRLIASPPAFTSGPAYMENVAHLHANSEDLVSRGLAVGCLSAIGKE